MIASHIGERIACASVKQTATARWESMDIASIRGRFRVCAPNAAVFRSEVGAAIRSPDIHMYSVDSAHIVGVECSMREMKEGELE